LCLFNFLSFSSKESTPEVGLWAPGEENVSFSLDFHWEAITAKINAAFQNASHLEQSGTLTHTERGGEEEEGKKKKKKVRISVQKTKLRSECEPFSRSTWRHFAKEYFLSPFNLLQ